MTSRSLRRGGAGLAMAAAVAFVAFAFVAVASAAAATQHWAGVAHVPSGSPQSFSSEADGYILIHWNLSGALVSIECESVSSSGSVENPAGAGTGTMSAESFSFGNCILPFQPHCALKNGSFSFEAVKSTVEAESGEDLIRFSPAGGGTFSYVEIESNFGSCVLAKSYPLRGYFSARESSGGHYLIEPSSTHLTLASNPLTVESKFSLLTPSAQRLVLSSSHSAGAPEWYYDSSEWTNLAAGEAQSFASSGSMSVSFDSHSFGAVLEIDCVGSGNSFAGSLQNPSGGGAATSSGVLTLGQCSTPNFAGKCTVKAAAVSNELSGNAIESGGAGSLELTASGGSIITIVVEAVAGKKCNIARSYLVKGTLIAHSEGNGSFDLSGSGITINGETTSAAGSARLETQAGELLRLQA